MTLQVVAKFPWYTEITQGIEVHVDIFENWTKFKLRIEFLLFDKFIYSLYNLITHRK